MGPHGCVSTRWRRDGVHRQAAGGGRRRGFAEEAAARLRRPAPPRLTPGGPPAAPSPPPRARRPRQRACSPGPPLHRRALPACPDRRRRPGDGREPKRRRIFKARAVGGAARARRPRCGGAALSSAPWPKEPAAPTTGEVRSTGGGGYADRWDAGGQPRVRVVARHDCANFVSQCLAAFGSRPTIRAGSRMAAKNGTAFPRPTPGSTAARRRARSRRRRRPHAITSIEPRIRCPEWAEGRHCVPGPGERRGGVAEVIICVGGRAASGSTTATPRASS